MMIPTHILQHEYLNLDYSITPAQLGFRCIFLGGSAAHRSSVEEVTLSGSDWDGLAIVSAREDLVNLLTVNKKKLLRLLKVDYIAGSDESWKVSTCLSKDLVEIY